MTTLITYRVPPRAPGPVGGAVKGGGSGNPVWPCGLRRLVVSSALTTAGGPFGVEGTGKVGAVAAIGSYGGDVEISPDGIYWYPLVPGSIWPVSRVTRREASVFLRRNGPGTGTLVLAAYGTIEEAARSASFIAGATPQLSGTSVAALPTRSQVAQGLTTAAAAGNQISPASAATKEIVLSADFANASAIYMAETQAKAALLGAAGGGTQLLAAGIYTWAVDNGQLWIASSGSAATCYPTENVT